MKIISAFKDYYDYKVAEYGLDETLVFDRRTSTKVNENLFKTSNHLIRKKHSYKEVEALHSVLLVGSELVHIFATEKAVYTQFDIHNWEVWQENSDDIDFKFADAISYGISLKMKNGEIIETISFFRSLTSLKALRDKALRKAIGIPDEKYADLDKTPLVLVQQFERKGQTFLYKNPQLSRMGLYIDADFVWEKIVQFLSDLKSEKEIRPEVPNDSIIQNKGFDKKTSFRPKMKK